MSHLQAVLAAFKARQKKSLEVQADARLERESKLAAKAGAGRGKAGKSAAGRGRSGRAGSAASGEASPSVASAAGGVEQSEWRRRQQLLAMPLGVKLKSIIDFLRSAGEPRRAAAIAAATGYDPATDRKLADALAVNSKVEVQADGLYAYRPEVANVRSKQEVLEYLRRRERAGEGYAALGELGDAYPGAARDLAELKREGLVVGLPAADVTRREVLYPVDLRLRLDVDSDLRELWLSMGQHVPDEEEELQEELRKIGVSPSPRLQMERRVAREKKKKARKARRLTKVTNAHLAHLLEGDAPTNIETA